MHKFVAAIFIALAVAQVSAAPHANPNLWNDITKVVSNAAQAVKKTVNNVVDTLKSQFGDQFEQLGALVKKVAPFLAPYLKQFNETFQKIKDSVLKAATEQLKTLLHNLSENTDGKFQETFAAIETLVDSFQGSASSVLDRYAAQIDGDVAGLTETLKAQAQECQTKYQPEFSSLKQVGLDQVQACANAAKDQGIAILNRAKEIISDVPQTIKDLIQSGLNCVNSVVSKSLSTSERANALSCVTDIIQEIKDDVNEIKSKAEALRPEVEQALKDAAISVIDCGTNGANELAVQSAALVKQLVECSAAEAPTEA